MTSAWFFFRDEIAACTEKAYQCISFPEATRILYFESEKDMRAFAEKVWYIQMLQVKFLIFFKFFIIFIAIKDITYMTTLTLYNL